MSRKPKDTKPFRIGNDEIAGVYQADYDDLLTELYGDGLGPKVIMFDYYNVDLGHAKKFHTWLGNAIKEVEWDEKQRRGKRG